MMRRILLVCALFILCRLEVRADNSFIVEVSGGQAAAQQICVLLPCSLVRGLDGTVGQVFLLTAPGTVDAAVFLRLLKTLPLVISAEPDILESISQVPMPVIPAGLWDPWSSYANQPSTQIINLNSGRSQFNVSGYGTVAVIDTGIDPGHPALRGVIVGGYDFTRDTAGTPSEMTDITQPVSPQVDGVPPARLNQSTAALVDQDTGLIIAQYASFGHGTFVSGVVHMVAPTAMIMPLKAFKADGTGSLSDIIRAIYYGVQNGATVLNMSFSTSNASNQLQRAINYGTNKGVISIASAGNDGSKVLVYPAAISNVIGVASTDYQDQRSSFSNYGQPPVFVAAPGEQIISTFPFGTFAASSGTSFSAPMVTGLAALLKNLRPNTGPSEAAQAISHARPLGADLGYGRIDVYQALSALSGLR